MFMAAVCLQFFHSPDVPDISLGQACSTFYVVQATLAKFGLLAGNMKFSTQNEE
jgi:hypothetical protein